MHPTVKKLRRNFSLIVKEGGIVAEDICLKCQKGTDDVFQLEMHHKIPIFMCLKDRTFDPNTQENIATLCSDCHKGLHVSYEDMVFEDWLENVSIEEMYQKLEEYRAEKKAKRERHRLRHLKQK